MPGSGKTAVKLLVSAGLVAWILARTHLAAVGAAFRSADPRFLLAALALCPLGWLLSVVRWRLLIAALGGQAAPAFLLRSFLVGVFFNNLLPGTMGGDAVRAYDTARSGIGRGRAVTLIFVDRFLGLVALLLFAGAALAAGGRLAAGPALAVSLAAGGALAALAAWLLFARSGGAAALARAALRCLPQRFQPRAEQAVSALRAFEGRHRVLAQALALSLALQALVVANAALLAAALHLRVPLTGFFLLVPLALFALMLPVSINGIGVRENVWAFFLAPYGVAAAAAVAFAWLDYGLVLLQALIGGAVYALAERRHPQKEARAVSEALP